ncbi:MAG: aminotransferase class IV [Candidatus Omnitrophica bacterium]|jgi:branched-subunit amino acid aminotransferase/4-amino-4-deoxychorismate lyase|nr:aminotransferase class IV [Candidatus Omnitrophota bacterium]
MKIYLNGDLTDKEKLEELLEPGFLFGWGVFETLRTYQTKIPFLAEHTKRLNNSLKLLGLEEAKQDWEKIIKNLLSINSLKDAYVRITAYKKRSTTGLIIYADKFSYYNATTYEKGMKALVSSQVRYPKDICSKVKSISYLQNRISWLEAQKAKKDEALLLNPERFLAGGSRSNLFLVRDKKIYTPLVEDGAFDGITKRVIKDIAESLDLVVKEKSLTTKDLFNCEEAFITSTLMEVMPLVECNDKKIGKGIPGEITFKILSEYRKML